MRITDLLRPEAIQLHTSPSDKSAVIDLLADLHEKAGNISDKEAYKKRSGPGRRWTPPPWATGWPSPTPAAPR